MQKSVQDRCVELCFGFFQRIGYHKTANCIIEESDTLSKSERKISRVTNDGKNEYIMSIHDRVHEKTLEEIVELFIQDGRFDVSPEMLQFGEELRQMAMRFTTMTAHTNSSKSTIHQRLYGRPTHSRNLQPTIFVPSSPYNFANRTNSNFAAYTIQQSPHARTQLDNQMIVQQAEMRYRQQLYQQQQLIAAQQQKVSGQGDSAAATTSAAIAQPSEESVCSGGSARRKTHQPQSLNTMAKENLIDPLVGFINEKPWESVSDIALDDTAIFQSLDCIGKDFLATFDYAHNEFPQDFGMEEETFENGNLIPPIDNEVVIENEQMEQEEEVVLGSEHNLNIEQAPMPVLSPVVEMHKVVAATPIEKKKQQSLKNERESTPLRHSTSSSSVSKREKDRNEDRRKSRNHEESRRSHSPQSRNRKEERRENNGGSKERKDLKRKEQSRDERKISSGNSTSGYPPKKRPYPSEERPSSRHEFPNPSSSSSSNLPGRKQSNEKSSSTTNSKKISSSSTDGPNHEPKRVAPTPTPPPPPAPVPQSVSEKMTKNKMTSNLLNKLRANKSATPPPAAAPPVKDIFGDIDREMTKFEKKTPDELQAKSSWKIPKKSQVAANSPKSTTPQPTSSSSNSGNSGNEKKSSSSAAPSKSSENASKSSKSREKEKEKPRNFDEIAICEGDGFPIRHDDFITCRMNTIRLASVLVNVNDKYRKIRAEIEEAKVKEEVEEEETKVNTHPKTVGFAPQKGDLFAKRMMENSRAILCSDDEDEDDEIENADNLSQASPIEQEPSTSTDPISAPKTAKTIDLSKASDFLDKIHSSSSQF